MIQRKLLYVGFALLASSTAHAVANSAISYEGQILKPDGTPLEGQNTQFKLQIRTPDGNNCLMYEELQTLDLRNSGGNFSLSLNDGMGSRTDSTALTIDQIFANRGTFTFNPATCSSGSTYVPGAGDARKLVVLFKDDSMSTWEPIPAETINYAPLAIEAKQIAGFGADSLLRVTNPSGAPIGGLAPLSNTQYTELMALVNGTSNSFTKAGQLGGIALPTMTSGEVLGWNGSAWVSQPATGGANSITTAMIQNSSVDSTKIASGAVGTTQIAANVSINTSGVVAAAQSTTRDFKIYAASPSAFYVGMAAPALTASYSLTWPMDDGNSGEVLTTNGAGVLSWTSAAGASQWTTSGSNVYYNTGNVGIGIAVPSQPLEVNGNAKVGGTLFIGAGTETGPSLKIGASNGGLFSPGSDVAITTSGSEKVRVTSAGKVGIGTSNPTALLQLKAGTASTAPFRFTPGTLLTTPEDGALEYDGTSLWYTIASTRYVIPTNTTSGNYSNVSNLSNVGGSITMTPAAGNSVIVNQSTVSTNSASGALIVNGGVGVAGAINTAGNIVSGGSLTAASNAIVPQLYGSTAAAGNLKIDGTSNATVGHVLLSTAGANAKVGVGTSVPNGKLDVKGSIVMSGATSGYAGFQPAAAAGSTIWTLPAADGTTGQVLSTNGSGVLSWTTAGGGGGFGDGSAAAPTVTFTSESNTGFYKHAANTLGMTVGGMTKMTATPSQVLFSDGGGNSGLVALAYTPNMPVTSNGTGLNVSYSPNFNGSSATQTYGAAISNTLTQGAVGSTLSSQTGLAVSSNAYIGAGGAQLTNQYGISIDYGSTAPGGTITSSYGIYSRPNMGSSGSVITNSYGLYLAIPIGSGGITNRYGVYQADGYAKNLFNGPIISQLTPGATSQDPISITSPDPSVYNPSSAGSLQPWTSGVSNALSISNSSATTGTAAFLGLSAKNSGSQTQRAYIAATSTAASSPALVFGAATSASAYSERMRIDASGNVGIGTTAPVAHLDVNGFMRLKKNAGAPAACTSSNDGAIALTSQYTTCVCNGGLPGWVRTNDGSTACVW